jgi:hypothetical protein
MPPKNTKIARSRALQDVTNVESEGANERAAKKQVIDSNRLRINTSTNRCITYQRIAVPDAAAPAVTARVTRRQSKELAKLHEEENSPNESSQADDDNAPISTNSIDLVVGNQDIESKRIANKKGPSRRKMKKSDPTQCLEIISPMYAIFYEQEVSATTTPNPLHLAGC